MAAATRRAFASMVSPRISTPVSTMAAESTRAAALSIQKHQQQIEHEQQKRSIVSPELIDTFGRKHSYLRISLTERCNLRCTYCMPEKGVDLQAQSEILNNEEVLRISKLFVSLGVRKIRLTGGEPLLRRDFVKLCEDLGALPGLDNLAITTNAITLERKLPALMSAGVNLLNISLDTLVPAKFEMITRRRGHNRVISAINAAVEQGFSPVKVNCVVKRGMNEEELVDFVEWTRHTPIEVRFIEYMPFDDNKWDTKRMLPYFEMVDMIKEKFPEFGRKKELDGNNPTSKTWHVPGFAGNIGFISSMSDAFCGSCNRMRITADGNVKACLFGNEELSLRDPMRAGVDDAGLRELVAKSVTRKNAKLGGHANAEAIAAGTNRPMILIGG